MFIILDELIENIDEDAFQTLIQEADIQVANLQRMGFLLENKLNNKSMAEKIFDTIKSKRLFKANLSNLNAEPEKEERAKNRWNVIENIDLESEI